MNIITRFQIEKIKNSQLYKDYKFKTKIVRVCRQGDYYNDKEPVKMKIKEFEFYRIVQFSVMFKVKELNYSCVIEHEFQKNKLKSKIDDKNAGKITADKNIELLGRLINYIDKEDLVLHELECVDGRYLKKFFNIYKTL